MFTFQIDQFTLCGDVSSKDVSNGSRELPAGLSLPDFLDVPLRPMLSSVVDGVIPVSPGNQILNNYLNSGIFDDDIFTLPFGLIFSVESSHAALV